MTLHLTEIPLNRFMFNIGMQRRGNRLAIRQMASELQINFQPNDNTKFLQLNSVPTFDLSKYP